MTERNGAALLLDDVTDVGTLERENRELATKQVRQINDTLRKVRRISEQFIRSDDVYEEKQPLSSVVHEVVITRMQDSRLEVENSSKFLIPEPSLESPVSEVFKKAFEMFERECSQLSQGSGAGSPVVRTWKLV